MVQGICKLFQHVRRSYYSQLSYVEVGLMNDYDKYVTGIYQRCMIKRSQTEIEVRKRGQAEMEKNFWAYLGDRLDHLIMGVMQLHQMRGVTKAQIDEAERGVSDLLNMVKVYTLPEVIVELTKDLQQEKNLILIKKKDKIA